MEQSIPLSVSERAQTDTAREAKCSDVVMKQSISLSTSDRNQADKSIGLTVEGTSNTECISDSSLLITHLEMDTVLSESDQAVINSILDEGGCSIGMEVTFDCDGREIGRNDMEVAAPIGVTSDESGTETSYCIATEEIPVINTELQERNLNKQIEKHRMKDPCSHKCRKECSTYFTETRRKTIWQ